MTGTTFVVSASRPGLPSAAVTEDNSGKTYMVSDVGAETTFSVVNASVTGVGGTGGVGTAKASLSPATLSGVGGTGGVGTLTATAGTSVNITGVAATSGVGTVTPEIDHTLTGVAGTSAIGTLTTDIPIYIYITGQAATAAIGTPYVEIDLYLTGLASTAHIGTIVWTVNAYTNVNGVAATALYTAPFAIHGPNTTTIYLTGQHATAGLGVPHASIAHTVTGQAATAQIGTPAPLVSVGGMQMALLECAEPHNASDISVNLRWSDTYGESWSGSLHQSMGAKGAYLTNLQFRRLGMARNRVFEVSWSAPSPTALQGVTLQFEKAAT